MQFKTTSSDLLRVLQSVGKVANGKNTMPILDYFLFETKDSKLSITASDMETTITRSMEVDNSGGNDFACVPIKRMQDVLKELSTQPIIVDINDSNFEVTIKWQTGELSFGGANANSYPTRTNIGENGSNMTINSVNLLNALGSTLFATADDELRPVMNGVYFDIDREHIIYVATDAHKMVRYSDTSSVSGNDERKTFIMPKKPISALLPLLSKDGGDISISFDDKNVKFELGGVGTTMVCRLVEGNYPNYDAVIPRDNPNKVIIDRVELLNAVKRVSVCSNPATNLVKFSFSDNKASISAQDLDFSTSATESVSCNYDGVDVTIGFKGNFLIDILSNLHSDTITIEMKDGSRAALFVPHNQPTNIATEMLLMPMMIQ